MSSVTGYAERILYRRLESAGEETLAHRHPLFYVQRSKISRYGWICDFCNKISHELQETYAYCCSICDFDICRHCFHPKKHFLHPHPLNVADAQCIYRSGRLICDVCDREGRFSRHCWTCKFDMCYDCFEQDSEHKVIKLVAPHFVRSLVSLEEFVQILESTSYAEISGRTAHRLMPVLIGHVNNARKWFDHAKNKIHEINEELNRDLEATVVREKTANDMLLNTQIQLNGINRSIKAKQDEEKQIERQLSNEKYNLTNANAFLEQKKKKLGSEKTSRNVQAGFMLPTVAGATLLGLLGGPIGAAVAGSVAAVGMGVGLAVLQNDVKKANVAVEEASFRVSITRQRLDGKTKELSRLRAELTAKETKKRETTQNLESIKQRKEQIKQLQKRLAKVNDAIKSCTTCVDTTALRTKMMADEANSQLPDIAMMLGPLKAIADDLGDASVSKNRLLCGGYNMRDIGTKIKMISGKAPKRITARNTDYLSEYDF